MINPSTVALIIYIFSIAVGIGTALSGKVYLTLLLLVPFFSLRNVLEKIHQFPFGVEYVNVFLILCLLGWVLLKTEKNSPKFNHTPMNRVIWFLIVWSIVTYVSGTFYLEGRIPVDLSLVRLKMLKNFVSLPILFFIVVNNIKNIKQMRLVILVIILSLLIVDYYTSFQIKWMSGLESRSKINGTFADLGPNELGAFLAMCSSVLLGIFFFDKKFFLRRCVMGGVIVFNLYCAVFLYSRGRYRDWETDRKSVV